MKGPRYSFRIVELQPQPTLVMRASVPPSRIAAQFREVMITLFPHLSERGARPVGPPFTRYLATGDTFDIEVGVPVAEAGVSEGEILAGELPGGFAAMTTHVGPYDALGEAHNALRQWVRWERRTMAGPPWEVYVTDPAEVEDPSLWRTDLYLPLAED